MPGLGETYGEEDGDVANLARLGLGYGLVVGGGAIVALGLSRVAGEAASALGAPAPVAARLGITLALLVLPLALVGLRTLLPGAAGRLPLVAGAGLVVLAVVGSWAAPASTGAGGVGGLAFPILLAYVLGLGLLSAGVLAGPIAASTGTGRATGTGSTVGFQRSTGAPGPGVTPADGGRDVDGDLEFPLDDE